MASSLLHLPLSPSFLRAWWFEDEDFKKRDKHITFEQDLQFWDIAFIASLLRDFVCQLFWACGIGFLLHGMMLLIWCCWLRASLVLSGVYKPTNLFLKQKADNEYMSFSPSHHSWISELINQFLLFFYINIYIIYISWISPRMATGISEPLSEQETPYRLSHSRS